MTWLADHWLNLLGWAGSALLIVSLLQAKGNLGVLDGVQQGSTYVDSTNYLQSDVRIGGNNDGSSGIFGIQGWFDEVRIQKVGLYSANFTPPTPPLS